MIGDASSLLLGFYHKNFTKFVALLIINLGEAKGGVQHYQHISIMQP